MFGAKRSHPAKLARRVDLALAHPVVSDRLATGLPKSANLSGSMDPPVNQGQSGSCTRGSTSLSWSCAFRAAGKPLGFIPSQRVGYAVTRALERAASTPPGQALPALQDTGAELADVYHADATYGVLPMLVQATPDGRFYDLWTDADTGAGTGNVNDEPGFAQLEQAGTRLVSGPYGIDPTAQNAAASIAAAIASGIPVEIAGFVDSAFMSLTKGQVMGAPNQSDPNGGGHAIWLWGYDTMADGSLVFTLRNSWGAGWCDGGNCLVGPAFIASLWEAWPVAVVTGVS